VRSTLKRADTHFYALGKGHRCLLHFNESISSLPMDDYSKEKTRQYSSVVKIFGIS
jgi:hypothetical protein